MPASLGQSDSMTWQYVDGVSVEPDKSSGKSFCGAGRSLFRRSKLNPASFTNPATAAANAASERDRLMLPADEVKAIFYKAVDDCDPATWQRILHDEPGPVAHFDASFTTAMENRANGGAPPAITRLTDRASNVHLNVSGRLVPSKISGICRSEWTSKPEVRFQRHADPSRGLKSVQIGLPTSISVETNGRSITAMPTQAWVSQLNTDLGMLGEPCNQTLLDFVSGKCSEEDAKARVSSAADAIARRFLATGTDLSMLRPYTVTGSPVVSNNPMRMTGVPGSPILLAYTDATLG